MRKKVLFLMGLPASGKSTYAKNLLKEDSKWVRINKDDIREQIFGGKWTKERERIVIATEESIAKTALLHGKSVVIDSTNFAPKHKERFLEIAQLFQADFEIKFFDVPAHECVRRDAKRKNPVGEKVIRQMFDRYVRPEAKQQVNNQSKSLPSCYIFDLDGTLAKMNGRSPYEFERVKEDSPNKPVVDTAIALARTAFIIIMTGRDGSCKDLCHAWLVENKIPYAFLFIREAGDCRKDSIIKRELYEKHIKDKFYVNAWFDDRDQVVEMVRDELNIPCFQVDWGNF